MRRRPAPARCAGMMARPGRSALARGFTLPEVLATLVLVGIILPVTMQGISLAVVASGDARHKVEAAALAENRLAELAAGASIAGQGGMMSGDFGPEWAGYRWEASSVVREVDLTELQVRVYWTARGADRWISLSTLVYTGTGTGAVASAGAPSRMTR